MDQQGNSQKALAAMLCSFPKASPEKPTLLEHGQVETLFHEFGHVMHMMCTRVSMKKLFSKRVQFDYQTNLSALSMDAAEGDFTEAPSQMLQNWV